MNVKCVFLNGFIQGEVYIEQPLDLENFEKSSFVYKLKNGLYELKQAPRVSYKRLSKYLLSHHFRRGKADTTFFIKRYIDYLDL